MEHVHHHKFLQVIGMIPQQFSSNENKKLMLSANAPYLVLDVQLCFRHFFSEIRGFIVKNWLYIYDSKYCPSLTTTFFHLSVAYESRVEKTGHLLRLSTNRSNFLLLHKTGSAGQPDRVPLIETSDS